jgi:hypothetical protein
MLTDELKALVAWLRDFADEWEDTTDGQVDVRGKLHRAATTLETLPVMWGALDTGQKLIDALERDQHFFGNEFEAFRTALASLPKEVG